MVYHGLRKCMCGVLTLGVIAGGALADDMKSSKAAASDEQLARLEALLDAQERKIAQLEQQVAATNGQDGDRMQVEEMQRQIRAVLSEGEFRESLMTSVLQAGYDDGFFIRSSDDNFSIKFNGLLQFRYTYYYTRRENRYLLPRRDRDDRSGFDLQRVRFAITGNAYNKDLTYGIEFSADAPSQTDVFIDNAWINWRSSDALQFTVGQFRLASTRTNMRQATPSTLQMIDNGIFHAVYGLGKGIGVRVWGQALDKRLDYYLDVVNSASNGDNTGFGRTITPDPAELDANPAVLLRSVWHALVDQDGDFAEEGDTLIHQNPVWDLGAHFGYSENYDDRFSTRLPTNRRLFPNQQGGFAVVSDSGLRFWQMGLDSAFKYMGFSATAEYALRIVDVRRRTSPWTRVSGDDSTTAQHGAYVQLGYFLPIQGLENKLELVGRVSAVTVLAEGSQCEWEYTGGLNYYVDPAGRMKVQTDVTYVDEVPITSSYASLANVNDDALIWRVQFQLSF
ncbi:MAG TPA: porin [Phycisphaerae bacterium]|nr:porin [Phycisphaerae bacterium]